MFADIVSGQGDLADVLMLCSAVAFALDLLVNLAGKELVFDSSTWRAVGLVLLTVSLLVL